MFDCTGQIVRSKAGHDKGGLFCVVGCEGNHLLLANGKQRRTEAPKRKKRSHVSIEGTSEHPAIQRLTDGGQATNRELREALAQFRAAAPQDQGGN